MSLVVTRATGLACIQDLGRAGHMHEALAPGGALVPELLLIAGAAARNPPEAAAIEVQGQLVVRAEAEAQIAIDDEPRVLAAGEEIAIASGRRRVAYLALRGGVAAPLVLGGCGAHLSAGLGAALRAGDPITSAGLPDHAPAVRPFVDGGPIRIVPGPDGDAFAADAIDILTAAPYRLQPSSDRVGTRLDGRPVPRRPDHPERSRPMVQGAIEVPRDGLPIVLGPEHPTTGGYPIVAVIARPTLGRFFAIRLGATVQFTLT